MSISSSDSKPVKIMISAAECSGEIHGAALVRAALAQGRGWSFSGLGGDRMAEAGVRLVGHIRDTAVMGLTEVVGSLPKILRLRRALLKSLELERPEALVLIDAPDFNFALARRASDLGIPVIYYICPQVWAWRSGRLKFLSQYTSRRALLFDFERRFYEERGLSADWVGHPTLDELPPPLSRDAAKAALGLEPGRRLLTLMPGSRRKVVQRLAPLLLAAAEKLLDKDQGLQVVLPRADSLEPELLEKLAERADRRLRERLKIIPGQSHLALAAADLAIMASGTSSVEATFLDTPQVVVYQVSRLSWFLGRRLISVPYASIANLVAGREVVPELLQERATPDEIFKTAWPVLAGGVARARMLEDLARVREELGRPGASGRVAEIIAEEIARRRAADDR